MVEKFGHEGPEHESAKQRKLDIQLTAGGLRDRLEDMDDPDIEERRASYAHDMEKIEDMAYGSMGGGDREALYPGWTDEDFRELLSQINDPDYTFDPDDTLRLNPSTDTQIEDWKQALASQRAMGKCWYPPEARIKSYDEKMNAFVDMARGSNGDGWREDFPGWTNEDFKELIRKVGDEKYLHRLVWGE